MKLLNIATYCNIKSKKRQIHIFLHTFAAQIDHYYFKIAKNGN